MCRVQRSEDSGGVDDGADVRAISAASGHVGGTEGIHQGRGVAAGELRDERLRIGVVEYQPVGVLGQAWCLLVNGLVEAILVDLDAQAASRHFGALFERFQVGLGCDLDLCQVGFDAHPVPTGGL